MPKPTCVQFFPPFLHLSWLLVRSLSLPFCVFHYVKRNKKERKTERKEEREKVERYMRRPSVNVSVSSRKTKKMIACQRQWYRHTNTPNALHLRCHYRLSSYSWTWLNDDINKKWMMIKNIVSFVSYVYSYVDLAFIKIGIGVGVKSCRSSAMRWIE
jgi:hypothetical protein